MSCCHLVKVVPPPGEWGMLICVIYGDSAAGYGNPNSELCTQWLWRNHQRAPRTAVALYNHERANGCNLVCLILFSLLWHDIYTVFMPWVAPKGLRAKYLLTSNCVQWVPSLAKVLTNIFSEISKILTAIFWSLFAGLVANCHTVVCVWQGETSATDLLKQMMMSIDIPKPPSDITATLLINRLTDKVVDYVCQCWCKCELI